MARLEIFGAVEECVMELTNEMVAALCAEGPSMAVKTNTIPSFHTARTCTVCTCTSYHLPTDSHHTLPPPTQHQTILWYMYSI